MKILLAFITKEFKQIFRDKGMLPLIFVMPLIQLLILANAVTFDIKNIDFSVVDYDRTPLSQKLINKINASSYFRFAGYYDNTETAEKSMFTRTTDLVIVIPKYFAKQFLSDETADIQLLINAIDGSRAEVEAYYVSSIIRDFQKIYTKKMQVTKALVHPGINISYMNWYNEKLNYKTVMVPGILVILVSIISMFLSSMSIAKEKEIGTIEQLNVTPILKGHLIFGKIIPVFIIGMMEFSLGLAVTVYIFDITIAGSLGLLYSFTAVYLLIMLSAGVLISTIADTQQQAMFVCWFFLVIFILLSGLFTPIESMPVWAQYITGFIPVSHYIMVIRNIMLKGSGFYELSTPFFILCSFAVVILCAAFLKYRKTTNQ